MRTPAAQLRRLERRAVRTELHAVLTAALAELDQARPEGETLTEFCWFLSELANALLEFRKGTAETRRDLRRMVFQGAVTREASALDAALLRALLSAYLADPAPTLPGLQAAEAPQESRTA
jgi:hypothetical protein